MRIDILTVLPEMIDGSLNCSILRRAQDRGLAEIYLHNLRDYTTNKWRRTDDYPFGGEAGMVMQIGPVDRAISALQAERTYDEVIYTSPDGQRFDQPMANRLSLLQNLIILCGHYKGVDYRIREHLITLEISVGDYVLTGGELAAAIIADTRDMLSMAEYCLTADRIPSGTPRTVAARIPLNEIMKLLRTLARTSFMTGLLVRYDVPRSKWTTAL